MNAGGNTSFQYGGQAVIEGVMMRGPDAYSVAVRRPDNHIVVNRQPVNSVTGRFKFLRLPFVRGTVVLIESLVLGIRALTYSAGQQAEDEKDELTPREIALTIALALGLAVLLFIVIPTGVTHFLAGAGSGIVENLIEGVIRLAVFLAYVAAISLIPDMQRVFQYHGAEHKVINAYEAGEELVPEKVQRFSTFHPRCGTSFLLLVMLVAILVFSVLGKQVLWWRVVSRILLLPVVAGISYEVLKISGRYQDSLICRLICVPGMWLQKMTTREPVDGQVEVAIKALKAVLAKENSSPDAGDLTDKTVENSAKNPQENPMQNM